LGFENNLKEIIREDAKKNKEERLAFDSEGERFAVFGSQPLASYGGANLSGHQKKAANPI